MCKILLIQTKHEFLKMEIAKALEEKRFEHQTKLRVELTGLNYTPYKAISAADMRKRLTALEVRFGKLYRECLSTDDEEGCRLYDRYQNFIKDILKLAPLIDTPPTTTEIVSQIYFLNYQLLLIIICIY